MSKARELYNLVEAKSPNSNSKLIRACIGNGDMFLNQISVNDKDKCLLNTINALIKVAQAQMKFEPEMKTFQNSALDATSSFTQINIAVIGDRRGESVGSKTGRTIETRRADLAAARTAAKSLK